MMLVVAQPGHLEKSSWMLTTPGPVQQGSCKRNLSLSGTDAGHSQGHAAVYPLSFLGSLADPWAALLGLCHLETMQGGSRQGGGKVAVG